jgi:hypothetical protein
VVAGVSLCFRGFSDEHHLFSLGQVPNHNAIILPSLWSEMPYMLVTVGIAKCSGGGIRIEVQRPQSSARAENSYADVQTVAAVLSSFGIPQNAVEYFLRLLSDIEVNQVLNFPPMDVPHHQLAHEDFRIADAVGGLR